MSLIACIQAVAERIGGIVCSFLGERTELSCSATREALDCSFEEVKGDVAVAYEKQAGLSFSFGLVCSSSLDTEECLWASDQEVITIEGTRVYLARI